MASFQLRAGQIFRLFVPYINPPKPKFLVLAYVANDQRARLFAINSEPTEFQKLNLADHQIAIAVSSYPAFLRHNSVLCCSELVGGWSAAELEDVLLNKPECLVGELRQADIVAVRAVVEKSRVLAGRDKDLILAQLR